MCAACKKDSQTMAESSEKATPPVKQLSVINGYPEGFAGCSCSLASSEEAYKAQQFIYLEKSGMPDPRNNFKMISIDGEVFKWFSAEEPEGFSVNVEYSSSEGSDPEIKQKKGILTVTFKNGQVIETPVFGYCGC
jgi:hypothetical protein